MDAIRIEKHWLTCRDLQIYIEKILPKPSAQKGIVLLHEGLGSVSSWKDFPGKLAMATQCMVVAYDRPGYGLSSKVHQPRSLNFLQEEADEILPCVVEKFFNNLPYVLLGHSDGGSIALAGAGLLNPPPIGLVVEAPHVMIEEQTLQGIGRVNALRKNQEFVSRLQKHHGDKTTELLDWWLEVWMRPEAKQWNIFDRLPLIDMPLLFIQGTDDDFGTLQQWEEIHKRVKGRAESLIIEDCGHIPHQQAEDRILSAIAEFLKSL